MGASREVAVVAGSSRSGIGRRLVEIGVGALVVALAAQAAVPVPFSPVPMTLQEIEAATNISFIVDGLVRSSACVES